MIISSSNIIKIGNTIQCEAAKVCSGLALACGEPRGALLGKALGDVVELSIKIINKKSGDITSYNPANILESARYFALKLFKK